MSAGRKRARLGVALVAAMLGAAVATLAGAAPAGVGSGTSSGTSRGTSSATSSAISTRSAAAGTSASTAARASITAHHLAAITGIPAAATPTLAIVLRDRTALRASPRDSAPQQAVLWQGEVLEVRGERLDHLQVWDHARERGGFVRVSQVHRSSLAAPEAPALLALVRFTSDSVGTEALGLGLTAAWLGAAPADNVRGAAGIEALDALGTFADRLAQRASAGVAANKVAEAALAAHLEVAGRYGVRFASFERDGRMQICYDGEAFRRVLAFGGQPLQQARAALALTRPECVDPAKSAAERAALDQWRAGVLDRVDAARLPPYLRNRVAMRRAALWSAIAFRQARAGGHGDAPAEAAERALAELASVDPAELTDDDLATYSDAAMRVNASRWAARSATAARMSAAGVAVATAPGEPGQTCVLLVDSRTPAAPPLARRCTYGIVWTASATRNREGSAVTVAVQPLEAWRELWVFRKGAEGWGVSVLPPASTTPGIGFAEFAGWVPGGRQMLVAREARGEGKHRRSFELVRLDGLGTERQSDDPTALGAFQRWQDAAWKRDSLSLR